MEIKRVYYQRSFVIQWIIFCKSVDRKNISRIAHNNYLMYSRLSILLIIITIATVIYLNNILCEMHLRSVKYDCACIVYAFNDYNVVQMNHFLLVVNVSAAIITVVRFSYVLVIASRYNCLLYYNASRLLQCWKDQHSNNYGIVKKYVLCIVNIIFFKYTCMTKL